MVNCLVRKLKESVSNPDLPVFGKLKLALSSNVTGSSNRILAIRFHTVNSSVEIMSGHLVSNYDQQTEVSSPVACSANARKVLYGKNSEDVVVCLNNYEYLNYFDVGMWSVDISQLAYSSAYTVINSLNCKGRLDSSLWSYIESLKINGSNVTGNIEQLKNNTTLKTINVSTTSLTGNVGELGTLPLVTTINIYGCQLLSGSALIFADNTKFTALSALDLRESSLTDKTAETKALIEAAHPGITVQL